MKRRLRRRMICALLSFCVLIVSPMTVTARTVEEIQEANEQLEQEKAQLEDELSKLQDDEAKKREYQETLQKKIDILEGQIDSARKDIDALNLDITALTMKLDKSREAVQSTLDKFKERLVALYKAGDVSTLEILLNSGSFAEFTMRSELVKTMTLHDQKLMATIESYMEDTQDERDECEKSKAMVASLKKQLENQQEELDDLYKKNAAAIAALQDAQSNTQRKIADNEAELADNEAEIQALIEEQKRREEEERRRREEAAAAAAAQQQTPDRNEWEYPIGGGGVEGFNPIWPLPGVSYISAGYEGYPGHKGLDIAGPYGTPVVAAESGTVIAANDYDSWGQSWGYYVLIYHNDTFTTRYAHLSGLTVSYGQYVEQGTIVGYEGATGNVTGPHLHFEVYQNGNRVDPMWFL